MGIVRDLSNLLVELLAKYDEPRITYICPDTRFYWDKDGHEAEIDACWEGKELVLSFGFLQRPEEGASDYFYHHVKDRVWCAGHGIALPDEWVEFMDAHFKKEATE